MASAGAEGEVRLESAGLSGLTTASPAEFGVPVIAGRGRRCVSARFDIHSGDRLTLKSGFGEGERIADVTFDVASGMLFMTFHFPESGTNRLTSSVLDRLADCPEDKLTPVQITRVVTARRLGESAAR